MPPQSIVIIGEPGMGKTRLVKHLMRSNSPDQKEIESQFIFVYLDCKYYMGLVEDWLPASQVDKGRSTELGRKKDISNYAAALFWWDLYNNLPGSPHGNESFSEPRRNEDDALLLDTTYDISLAIEKWVQSQNQPVIIILDNFEGIAHLPLRNSDRLRSIGDSCAFILTSRYALYVLHNYHQASWAQPSPFYNIFSDTVYLGLLAEQEVSQYLEKAAQAAEKSGSPWHEEDTAFIRKMAGRHPELLRKACTLMLEMLEKRLEPQTSSVPKIAKQDYQYLTFRLMQDARPLCKQLWEGLANPELYGQVGSPEAIRKEDNAFLSPYQLTMIEIAHGCSVTETGSLFELEQRGLIERINEEWHIFSEVMQQFVLLQEQTKHRTAPQMHTTSSADAATERDDERSLTYLEGKVYDYLKSHLGEVCDKREIMRAVWEEDNMPSNSALQKIIERIREKIEDDLESPYKLIAVRGRGYMLRKAL